MDKKHARWLLYFYEIKEKAEIQREKTIRKKYYVVVADIILSMISIILFITLLIWRCKI